VVQIRPTLHKESRPIFNSNQAIPIGANVETSPQGFTLGASVSFTSEFLPNFNSKNMILTCTKDFSLKKKMTQICQIFYGKFHLIAKNIKRILVFSTFIFSK
jgi:hypothetical protein